MKKILLVFLLLPALVFAQKKPKSNTPKKTVAVVKKAADEFIINANITGFPDGTKAELLNGLNGQTEMETTITKNKFTLKGKSLVPDFKLLRLNGQPPYTTLLIDNSTIKIVGNKDSIGYLRIIGSKSNLEYQAYINSLQQYQQAFDENAPYDAVIEKNALDITSNYVTNHPRSYVAPLAIIHYNQIKDDATKLQQMYNILDSNTKITPMGNYIVQLIEEAKKNGYGTVLPDFSQADTAGNQIALSSLRGKYVLIDFWASWCRPCRQENPNVVAAFNQFQSKNFTVLGVSLDKDKTQWLNAIKMDNLTWTHVSDLQGWQNVVAQQNQIASIPQNILIDTEGKIIGKNLRGVKLIKKLSTIIK